MRKEAVADGRIDSDGGRPQGIRATASPSKAGQTRPRARNGGKSKVINLPKRATATLKRKMDSQSSSGSEDSEESDSGEDDEIPPKVTPPEKPVTAEPKRSPRKRMRLEHFSPAQSHSESSGSESTRPLRSVKTPASAKSRDAFVEHLTSTAKPLQTPTRRRSEERGGADADEGPDSPCPAPASTLRGALRAIEKRTAGWALQDKGPGSSG